MNRISPVNVFTPAKEIEDVRLFAGRSRELQALARALESDGVHIVIYGNRGIGKSSLARLLERMATNDEAVIRRLDHAPTTAFDFLTVFFRCDDSITSVKRLLLRLLTDEAAFAPWVPYRVVAKNTTEEIRGGVDVKIIQLGASGTSSITEAAEELETDVVSVFSNALNTVQQSGIAQSGTLIIIDEFDRIRDKTGFASLLKSLGPQRVTFALVGVATTVQELILDHESVARQLADGTVHVPPMSPEEMNDIFERAEAELGHKYCFEEDTRAWIIDIARGHPFYVHLVGKHALLRTIDHGRQDVSRETAAEALREIALKGSAPVQETAYKTAIGHSYVRERLLKAFAAVTDEEIHTTELYAQISRELGIDPGVVSVYVGQLASEKFGAPLVKTRERYYRFADSLFKAYAAARPYQLRTGDQEDA